MEEWDVAVVGGSFAGLAAALYVARARRKVLVLDSGEPRNRFARHSHGVFTRDGEPGSSLLKTARAQLLSYPTAKSIAGKVRRVAEVERSRRFEVETEAGEVFTSRRLILATGLVDLIPEIPGIKTRWGVSVFHCPYCDGYEVGEGPLGVVATLPLSVDFATIVADWGSVTFYTNGATWLEGDDRTRLARRGIRVEERRIAALEGPSDEEMQHVRLADDRRIEARALFIATKYTQAAPFAADLGCELLENPRGVLVRTDESKMTTVPGVYAAGDMARPTHSIPFATSDGVIAGVAAHQSLIAEAAEPS